MLFYSLQIKNGSETVCMYEYMCIYDINISTYMKSSKDYIEIMCTMLATSL